MTPEQMLDASAADVVVRAGKLGFGRVMERLGQDEVEALLAHLNAGAHLEVRISMTTPPAVRVMLLNGHDEVTIGEIVHTLPKDRIQ